MIADFHIHSKYSYDSILSPRIILKVAKKRGLDMIAITDHDTIKGGMETQKLNADKDFFVIVGTEVCTEVGDLIGLNLNEEIKSKKSIEIIEEIRSQGGCVVLPHPYRNHILDEYVIANSDAIEVFNSRSTNEQNFKALCLAKKNKKLFIAGSDAHFAAEIGNTYLEINDCSTGNIKNILKFDCEELNGYQSSRCFVDASQVVKSMKKKEFFIGSKNFSLLLYHIIKGGF